MDDLQAIYQQVIIDHSKNPRNFGEITGKNVSSKTCNNPICGDEIHVHCIKKDGNLEQLTFTGSACAICTASASLMTEFAKGKSFSKIEEMFSSFHDMLCSKDKINIPEDIRKLSVMQGVSRYPMRVKCATCPWHAMIGAIKEDMSGEVTTE